MDSLKKVTKGKGNAVVPSESKNEKSKNVVNKNIKEGAKDKKNLPPKKQHEEEEDDDEEEEEDIEEDIEEEEEEGEENGDDDDVEGDQDDEEDDGEDGENGDDNEDDDDEEEDEDADSNPKKRKQSKVSLDANPNNKKQQGNTATLLLLGFPYETTEEQLREFLEPCGKIHSLAISETRRGTAKAVIDRQSLEKGLELNQKYIGERFVVVREYSDEPRSNPSSESKVIFVGNLGSDADESEIRELFEHCGEIKGVRLGKDRETGEFKGYAYVEFDSAEAPKKAIELNGNDFNGKSIKVDIDRKGQKKDNFGRRGGFGDRRGGGRGGFGDRRGGGGGFRGGRGFGGDRRGGDGERRGGGGFRGGFGDRRGGGGGFRGGRGFGGDRRGGGRGRGGRDF